MTRLSRRKIVTGLAAAPIAASPALAAPIIHAPSALADLSRRSAAKADPAISPCDVWLAQQREITRLNLCWSRREAWLADRFPWFKLSPDEQQGTEKPNEFNVAGELPTS